MSYPNDPNQPPNYGAGGYGQQPYGGFPGGTPAGPEPDNNLVWAILSTVLCCLPLGIVSIVKSTSVSKLWAAGDYAGAQKAADEARAKAEAAEKASSTVPGSDPTRIVLPISFSLRAL